MLVNVCTIPTAITLMSNPHRQRKRQLPGQHREERWDRATTVSTSFEQNEHERRPDRSTVIVSPNQQTLAERLESQKAICSVALPACQVRASTIIHAPRQQDGSAPPYRNGRAHGAPPPSDQGLRTQGWAAAMSERHSIRAAAAASTDPRQQRSVRRGDENCGEQLATPIVTTLRFWAEFELSAVI